MADVVVGEMPQGCDLVVIGAGPGGYTAALEAAHQGRKVTLVDAGGDDAVGGVCLLAGCIPSKALIELASARHDEERRDTMGLVSQARPEVDLRRFQSWKDSVVQTLGDGVRTRLRKAGVEVIRGTAAFTGPRSMRLTHGSSAARLLEFNHAVVATGSVPVTLAPLDHSDPRVLDAEAVLGLEELPGRVVVVGGGYVGVELGTALRKLGAHVTLIEAADRLLPGLDPRLGRAVEQGMRALHCEVQPGTTVIGLEEQGVVVTDGRQTATLPADRVVVAAGRRPNTTGLGLDRAGARTNAHGHVVVDARMLATQRIAAIGDVVPGPGLAHKASAQARVAVESLAGRRGVFDHLVPAVVFSDPEVASVGLGLAEADAQGYLADELSVPVAVAGRSLVLQRRRGSARLIYDKPTGLLLGASVSGPQATELIAEMTLAIEAGLQVGDLAGTIHPHPTLSEVIAEAAMQTTITRDVT